MKKYTNDPIINEVIEDHIKRHKKGMKVFKKTIHKNPKPNKDAPITNSAIIEIYLYIIVYIYYFTFLQKRL